MKILMLTDSMENGGAETHVYELSRSLFLLGHSVTVLSRGGEMARRLGQAGVRHVTVRGLTAYPKGLLPSLAALRRVIRELQPTVIHAHTRQTALLCHLLSPFLRVPCVFTAHALFDKGGLGSTLRLFRGRVIAVSEDIARHLTNAFGIKQDHITVIGNGIDPTHFSPVAQEERGAIRLLTVSRLDRDCALSATLLCEILPRLREKFPITLTVVGGGDALEDLRALATHKKLSSVRFVGAVRDVRPYLAECDVFVGVSRAALEAMAMEKPVILSGNEGYGGILTKELMQEARENNFCARGWGLPTAERLLCDLEALLSAGKERRLTLGKQGREEVLTAHTALGMAKATLDVYEESLRASPLLLCGYYGYGNLGDELVLKSLLLALREQKPDLPVAVLGGKETAAHGVSVLSRRHPFALLRALRQSRMVLLGGGTLLQDRTSRRSLLYYLSLLALARRFGTPYGVLLGGVGPLERRGDGALCKSLLADASFLALRDQASLALLVKMGFARERLLLGADPVLALPLDETPPKSNTFLTVFPRKNDHKNKALVEEICEVATKHALPVRLAAMDKWEDSDAAKAIAAALSARGIPCAICPSPDLGALVSLLSHSALVISRRLHALILCYRLGIPALAVSDDPKLVAFLEDAFSPEIARRLSLSPTAPLSEATEYALANRDLLTHLGRARLPILQARAGRVLSDLTKSL